MKSTLSILAALTLVGCSSAPPAPPQPFPTYPQYGHYQGYAPVTSQRGDTAEVIEVRPVQGRAQQYCSQVQISGGSIENPQASTRSMWGALIGAVTGGLVGSLVGNGMGNTVAIGVGSAIGGVTGDRLNNPVPVSVPITYERQCANVPGPITFNYRALVRRTGAVFDGSTQQPIQIGQLIRANVSTTTMLEE